MEFRLSAEEEAFRGEVRKFLGREVAYPPEWKPYHQFAMEGEQWTFVKGVARRLGERGWLTLPWPKEYGGRQAPMLDAILAEELAYYGVLMARDAFGIGMLAPTLIKFGTEAQKRQHLPLLAQAQRFWCQGYSEPGAGSDLGGAQLRAEEKDNYFLINGQKMWTTNAHNADWIFFVARTDLQAMPKHRGLSFFLGDLKTPGITVRPLLGLTGSHETNEVFFDNFKVPKENLVGEKNRGFYIAMGLLEFERSMGQFLGNIRRAFERLTEYAVRKGLSQQPRVRHKLAEIAVEIEVARWLDYRNTWLKGQDVPLAIGPSISKVFASELGRRLYQVGMEVLGLYGLLTDDSQRVELEGELAYLYFDSVKDTIVAGASEIQRNIIATRGLNLPRE